MNPLNRAAAGFFALGLLVLTGCAGRPPGRSVPDWLATYPADSEFYVGIGGSGTGNLAEDRDRAAAAARADLAAQISAQVSSELDVSTSATNTGDFNESVERRVNESVEQNLKSVETVDTWMSPEQGAWVYVRLSKAVWAAIVNKEIADLSLRTNAMLQAVNTGKSSEAEALAALGRARDVLISSPWGSTVKDIALGRNGYLLDSINAEISERTGSLSLRAEVQPSRVTFGSEVNIRGTVASGSGRIPGAFPLLVVPSGSRAIPVLAESDGTYSVTMVPITRVPGTLRIEVLPDLSAWNIPSEGFPVVRASAEVLINPILLALSVDFSASSHLSVLNGAVEDWVSELPLPAEIPPSGRGDADLEFTWTVFDFPRSDRTPNAPFISRVGAVITLYRNGSTVFVEEVEAFKDGGIDWNQAHQRAAHGLLDALADDAELAEEFTAALRGP